MDDNKNDSRMPKCQAIYAYVYARCPRM